MSARGLRAAVALVATAGLGVAGYLTWVHYQPQALLCTSGGGCETVQQSSYAVVLGLPVALLGLLAYATVLALTAWDAPAARTAVAGIALAALAFAAYLVVLQLAVIHAVCVWCLANDLVLVPALAVTASLRLRAR